MSLTEELPVHRLQHRGCRSLSDAELVSTLLECNCSKDALEMAREVLGSSGLASLFRLEESHRAKPATLLAAVELAQRLARTRISERRLMQRPDLVASYLWMRYSQIGREIVGALYLDVYEKLIEERELARGTLSQTVVDTRMFLKPALDCGAARMIMFHTHPSGTLTPSPDDLTFTDRLDQAAEVLGIKLVDHLILGSRCQYASLHQRADWRGKS